MERPGTAHGISFSASDLVDRENPYEQTWSILRALKAEVRDLQAALHAEHHLREEEVGKLTKELKECREELYREKNERKSDQSKHAADHKSEAARLDDDMRKARAMREQQVRELQEALEDEKKGRTHDMRELSERLKAEEATREKEAKGLADALADMRRRLDLTWNSARDSIHGLTQDVKLISDQMIRASSTWSGFRSECLMSTQPTPKMMSPRASFPPTMATIQGTTVAEGLGV